MKRIIRILAVLALLCLSAAALASRAPTSQFGYRGWPYRQPGCASQPARPAATKAPSGSAAASPTEAPLVSRGDYTTISLSAQEQKVWNLLNEDRQKNGLSPLPLDEELCRLARLKSDDMRDGGYFAHESPTYGRAADMLRRFDYSFRGVGENIAHHATVEKADAAFMSSSGHRQNILGRQWTKVGVGVSIDRNGFVYVTQLFVR